VESPRTLSSETTDLSRVHAREDVAVRPATCSGRAKRINKGTEICAEGAREGSPPAGAF
jgi:hypothetical protein